MLSGATTFAQERALNLGSAAGQFGETVSIGLTLDSSDDVQGIVAAAQWDDTVGTGSAINLGAAVAGAEIAETRIENGFAVVGIVIDINGEGPDSIPAGNGIDVATLDITCGDGEGTSSIDFVDGTHASVDGGPALDNIIVVGGLSIGTSDGLVLNSGELRCIPPPDEITVWPGDNDPRNESRCGTVDVTITNNSPVEGFVVAVCYDNTIGPVLDSIGVSGAAAGADFAEFEVDIGGTGFTAGVVIDLLEPFVPDFAIPVGTKQTVLTATFCCPEQPANGPDLVADLTLCDGVLGAPAKDNLLVIGGQSIGISDDLKLNDEKFTCFAPTEIPPEATEFHCSARDGSEMLSGPAGGSVEVCFGVRVLEDGFVGHAQPDHIQGFSMAVSYCPKLSCNDELDIGGTILEALGAEFVSIQCDNTTEDGDGHELIIGVLIDALPPFDGATIAPSPDVQPVGYVTFDIADFAECGAVCNIEFVDNLNGNGNVPIKNLVSAENHSRAPAKVVNCAVTIHAQERFFRGDCNFSLMGTMAVDIADAAAVVSYLFLPGSWQFQPGCLDACDCNDDGRVDLADSVCILQYLFQGGGAPPAPGPGFDPNAADDDQPGPGSDPTDDKLNCELGSACVLSPW